MTTPSLQNAVRWYHHVLVSPIKLLTAFNLGPFGGSNSVSAVIEALLTYQQGREVDFPLSKTERFLFEKLRDQEKIDELIEYRELNHRTQEEILRRWADKSLGIIWLGGGVFTLNHPLLQKRKPEDFHVWTDAHPKVVSNANQVFLDMKAHGEQENLSYSLNLPDDVDNLNRIVTFLQKVGVEHIVFFAYGMSYVLNFDDNLHWLQKLERPEGMDYTFVMNAPGGSLSIFGKIVAAIDNQPLYLYEQDHVAALFNLAFPGSEMIWSVPRKETRNKGWATWMMHIGS